ncbi:MAG: hypothetical protein K2Y27_04140 [Xanthobacteraceae bacterium]|nr:hypothetical protein [Xanthobacteraceae bacterium]
MTVSRRPAANRRHAWRCTGPVTALGKLRAARNALRHGLNVPVLADPVLEKEVAELAVRIANGSTDSQLRELAVQVAAAQIDLRRVRHARHAIMDALAAEPGSSTASGKIQELVALDRYERRAMSRRKSAILAFAVERLLRET